MKLLKTIVSFFLAFLLLLTFSAFAEQKKEEEVPIYYQVGANQLSNGDFAQGDKQWGTYTEGGNLRVDCSRDYARISVNSVGKVKHGAQLFYDGFRLIRGGAVPTVLYGKRIAK